MKVLSKEANRIIKAIFSILIIFRHCECYCKILSITFIALMISTTSVKADIVSIDMNAPSTFLNIGETLQLTVIATLDD